MNITECNNCVPEKLEFDVFVTAKHLVRRISYELLQMQRSQVPDPHLVFPKYEDMMDVHKEAPKKMIQNRPHHQDDTALEDAVSRSKTECFQVSSFSERQHQQQQQQHFGHPPRSQSICISRNSRLSLLLNPEDVLPITSGASDDFVLFDELMSSNLSDLRLDGHPILLHPSKQPERNTYSSTALLTKSKEHNSLHKQGTSTAVTASAQYQSHELGPYDVMCGRTSDSFNHIGNRRFRVTVGLFLERYLLTEGNKQERSGVILSAIEQLRGSAGARFLRKKGNCYVELTSREMKQKVGHALRDLHVYNQKRKVHGGGGEDKRSAKQGRSASIARGKN